MSPQPCGVDQRCAAPLPRAGSTSARGLTSHTAGWVGLGGQSLSPAVPASQLWTQPSAFFAL